MNDIILTKTLLGKQNYLNKLYKWIEISTLMWKNLTMRKRKTDKKLVKKENNIEAVVRNPA